MLTNVDWWIDGGRVLLSEKDARVQDFEQCSQAPDFVYQPVFEGGN